MAFNYIIVMLLLLIYVKESKEGLHERRLLKKLFQNYNPMERPVNETLTMIIGFRLSLQQIIDLDEKNQILTTSVWLNLDWKDMHLHWSPSDYGGLQTVRVSSKQVWIPDLLLYNSAAEKIDTTLHTNVIVSHNGTCLWVPPGVYMKSQNFVSNELISGSQFFLFSKGIFKTTCKVDTTWFPFDHQHCYMKFGSWSHDGASLDLSIGDDEGIDLSTFSASAEWILRLRRTMFYTFNTLIPCVLISSLAVLVFALPPDSGEKITLGITILLSMTVFLVQLSDTMPSTSESLSILAVFYTCIMLMVGLSVVMTVLVLNLHHRGSDPSPMPQWMQLVLVHWLAWLLRMSNQKKNNSSLPILESSQSKNDTNDSSKENWHKNPFNCSSTRFQDCCCNFCGICCNCFNRNERGAKIKPDSAKCAYSCKNHICVQPKSAQSSSSVESLSLLNSAHLKANAALAQESNYSNNICNYQNLSNPSSWSKLSIRPPHHLNSTPIDFLRFPLTTSTILNAMLDEIRYLTNRMKINDHQELIVCEWKFASRVLDRLCLLLFTTFTVSCTSLFLISANLQDV